MSSITQFPFHSDTAPGSKVVEWLAEVLYTKEYREGGYDKSDAKKRVRARVCKLANEGLEQHEIAEKLGIHKSSVSRHVKHRKREGDIRTKEEIL
jgi:DNA invertase Pin-like site-specific DNA recombinase